MRPSLCGEQNTAPCGLHQTMASSCFHCRIKFLRRTRDACDGEWLGPLGRFSGFPRRHLPARFQGLTRPEDLSDCARDPRAATLRAIDCMALCQDIDAFARGGRGRALRPSFRPGPGARTPSPAPRNGTRRAVARGLGLPRGRRVATRHAPYAPRRLDFLYLAAGIRVRKPSRLRSRTGSVLGACRSAARRTDRGILHVPQGTPASSSRPIRGPTATHRGHGKNSRQARSASRVRG